MDRFVHTNRDRETELLNLSLLLSANDCALDFKIMFSMFLHFIPLEMAIDV